TALLIDLEQTLVRPPAAADWDGDGREELVVCTADAIYLIHLEPQGDVFFATPQKLTTTIATPSAGPMLIDRQGQVLLVWGEENGRLALGRLSNDQFIVSEITTSSVPISGTAAFPSDAAVAVAADTDGLVWAIDADGQIVWQSCASGGGSAFQPLTADLDGRSDLQVVLVSNTGAISIWNDQGVLQLENSAPREFASTFIPALGDMDRDGRPELLFNGDGVLAVYEQTGWPTTDFPVSIRGYQSHNSAPLALSPIWIPVAQTTGATSFDPLAIIVGGEMIAGFDSQPKAWPGLQLTLSAPAADTPVCIDLDGDGDLDLFALAQDGFLYGWDLPIPALEATGWLLYGGDSRRTFHRSGTSAPPTVADQLMPPQGVFCYPNPTRDHHTQIRYSLLYDARSVTIRIYDLAGEFVQSLSTSGIQAGDHEVGWQIDSVQSGVYLARVEAESDRHKDNKVIKIAVVK
ncbi:T9SS type A sorting domain-containing protein, partial [candidate division KSB1 bacterium]|nr:T9SS type A sorting domain-containing protein [candidate division KSB1 bacterium]